MVKMDSSPVQVQIPRGTRAEFVETRLNLLTRPADTAISIHPFIRLPVYGPKIGQKILEFNRLRYLSPRRFRANRLARSREQFPKNPLMPISNGHVRVSHSCPKLPSPIWWISREFGEPLARRDDGYIRLIVNGE